MGYGLLPFGSGVFGLDVSLDPTIQFTPPTHEEPIRVKKEWIRRYRLTHANSVIRIDGVFRSVRAPSNDLFLGKTEGVDYFRGGRIYTVTQAVADELHAAGFPTTYTITPYGGTTPYGSGPYGGHS